MSHAGSVPHSVFSRCESLFLYTLCYCCSKHTTLRPVSALEDNSARAKGVRTAVRPIVKNSPRTRSSGPIQRLQGRSPASTASNRTGPLPHPADLLAIVQHSSPQSCLLPSQLHQLPPPYWHRTSIETSRRVNLLHYGRKRPPTVSLRFRRAWNQRPGE